MSKIILFLFFSLLFFVPRYFSHLQYDALEDEILAIGNNLMYPINKLIFAPDFTHPPLWYILMDYPTSILGLNHGIFYYRLIQVLSLFCLLVFALVYFYKKLPNKFLFTFFSLFLSNIYLVHLTSQHRMYAIVLGISIFYSFYWYHLIKNGDDKSLKHFIALGLIAAIGFFINYSIIWLIPIWPLAYLFYKRDLHALKRFGIFSFTFLILIAWFVPTFVRNANISIEVNQWASDLNFINALQMFNNYFGLIPMQEELKKINPLAIIFLILFFVLIFYKIFSKNKNSFSISIFISTFVSFALFLLTVYLTKNSFLYPRPAITLIIAFYVLIADALTRIKYSKFILFLLVLIQSSQFILYFNPYQEFSKNYFFVDYRRSTIGYFEDYGFPKNSCLITFPDWNTTAAEFFLDMKVHVIHFNELLDNEVLDNANNCSQIYLLDQTSVETEVLDKQHLDVLGESYNTTLVDSFENQNLYILNR